MKHLKESEPRIQRGTKFHFISQPVVLERLFSKYFGMSLKRQTNTLKLFQLSHSYQHTKNNLIDSGNGLKWNWMFFMLVHQHCWQDLSVKKCFHKIYSSLLSFSFLFILDKVMVNCNQKQWTNVILRLNITELLFKSPIQ